MSDNYRPPKGPRSGRAFNDDKKRSKGGGNNYNNNNNNYNQTYEYRDSYSSNGPGKRYKDRDSFRGGASGGGASGGERSSRNDGYSSRGRPSAPSSYRSNDRDFHYRGGYKRLFPSESRNFSEGGEEYRKRQDRGQNANSNVISSANANSNSNGGNANYHNRDKSNKYHGGSDSGNKAKVNMKNVPKGPRFTGGKEGRGKQKGQYGKNVKDFRGVNKQPIVKLTPSQIYLIKINQGSEIYERVQQVGEGTYGKVYKAKNTITLEYVALKKLRLETEREGFPITAIREIKLLQSFDHENVVGLLEMMVETNQIYMIFDYMDHDLTGLLTHPDLKLTESHRKFIFKQLMEGLNYLHKKRVIHRDIKGSNILLDSIGRLKIADFGLARTMNVLNDGETPDYTNRVITIWYRPPELLLGSTDYGREVDVWGVGCLLIELYSKVAAFQGFDEVGQLYKIFSIMGTPTIADWPDIENLPWFEMLKPKINKASVFERDFKGIMSDQSFNLATNLLKLNPKERFTAAKALEHPFFTEDPPPMPLDFLKDVKGEWHEFETKKRRRKERKRLQEVKMSNSQVTASVNNDPTVQSGPDSVVPPDGLKE